MINFIRVIGLALLILFAAFVLEHKSNQLKNENSPSGLSEVNQKSVIVVGAGISGLRAADLLTEAGMKVVVLEARHRVGGRLWSDRSIEGVALDLGGSWIHGINDSSLYDYAKQQQIPMVEWDYDKVSVFEPDGSKSNLSYDNADATEEIITEHAIKALISNIDSSVQDVIDRAKKYGDLSDFTDEQINFFVNTEFELGSAIDASEIPVLDLYDGSEYSDEEDPEDPEVVFPKGYDQIASALSKGLNIRLNTKVTKIDYSKEEILVTTNTSSLKADYVLVTVPLGVLKKRVIEFIPELPTEKLVAIDSLDMGILNKVYLKFPHIFWDNNDYQFGYISKQKGQFSAWLNLAKTTGQPVLMAFNAGSFALKLESQSNAEITTKAMTVLKTIYGDLIPEPTDVRITRWGQDPYSFGSYSYLTIDASNSMRNDLALSIDERVFFAGEATSEEYSATVDGAFLTGEREAEKILALQQ
ncbi:MAG: NAD(P)-binding protein [Gammaproteobacteria bacterium]|nr:NAD(P)-binding protein [Gammaproteobacteria bacterium]